MVTAHNDYCLHPEALAFVGAGFIHRLSNLLFTIQGQAQLLQGSEESDRKPAAIQNAARLGGQTLGVLSSLLGPVSGTPEHAGDLLTVIGDLVRIPLREAGYQLASIAPDEPNNSCVSAGSFCPAVFETVRMFVQVLPVGQGGTVTLELLSGKAKGVSVRIWHTAAQGTLPFPLAIERIRTRLTEVLRVQPLVPQISVVGSAIKLDFRVARKPQPNAAEQA